MKRERMKSFEADDDVEKLIKVAQKAPGFELKKLCNDAIRKYGPPVIAKMLAEERGKCEEAIADLRGLHKSQSFNLADLAVGPLDKAA